MRSGVLGGLRLWALRAVAAVLYGAAAAGVSGAEAPVPTPSTPAVVDDQYFDIAEIRVLGNSTLASKDVERVIYPYTGPHKSIADVQAARAALEGVYHAAGFGTVFVDIPEQKVNEGVVRLRVTEGRLDRIHVSGARYFSDRRILASLPEVRPGSVPQLPLLQSELATVNAASADRSVAPVLKAGRTPGTVDLDLRVKDTLPFHGGLTVNNRYTPDTTHLRSTLDLSYGNLFQDFQSIAFEYQTAPQRVADERVVSLSYVAPLGSVSNLLAVYAIDTSSNVAAAGDLALLGVGRVYGVHLIHTFGSTVRWSQNLNVGGDFKDFSQTVNVVGQPADKTPIRYINWSLVYSLNEHAARHDTSFSLGADVGIRGLANDSAQFDFKRFKAQADYLYFKGSMERREALALGTALNLRLAVQLAESPLISNEQIGIGGVDTVRGYLESIALGDYGASAALELRAPNWTFGSDAATNYLAWYAFYDAGTVRIVDALPLQQSAFTLRSAGLGLRLVAFRRLEATLNWAVPFTSIAPVVRNHPRLEFQAHFGF